MNARACIVTLATACGEKASNQSHPFHGWSFTIQTDGYFDIPKPCYMAMTRRHGARA